MVQDVPCPICNSPANRTYDIVSETSCYTCGECGKFGITKNDTDDFLGNESKKLRYCAERLPALLFERSISKSNPYFVFFHGEPQFKPDAMASIAAEELIKDHWPLTVSMKLDRALKNLCAMSAIGGHVFRREDLRKSMMFALTDEELRYNIGALESLKYLQRVNNHVSYVQVSPAGWKRFDRLTQRLAPFENPVFVAMWYGGSESEMEMMKRLYEAGLSKGIRAAGFNPLRQDMDEKNNDYIMDKVLKNLVIAPFVVADFTNNRNGVYFEAGYARGLGKEVIHTCKKESFPEAHFDTKQLNHILYDEPSQVWKPLRNRIIRTVGLGPFKEGLNLGD